MIWAQKTLFFAILGVKKFFRCRIRVFQLFLPLEMAPSKKNFGASSLWVYVLSMIENFFSQNSHIRGSFHRGTQWHNYFRMETSKKHRLVW